MVRPRFGSRPTLPNELAPWGSSGLGIAVTGQRKAMGSWTTRDKSAVVRIVGMGVRRRGRADL
jgi:hypothetical protein